MAKKTSNLAVWSLVSSILGVTGLPIIGSIVGLVLGYMAKREIDASGGVLEGRGLAKAGIIIGWIGVGIFVLSLCAFVVIMVLTFRVS